MFNVKNLTITGDFLVGEDGRSNPSGLSYERVFVFPSLFRVPGLDGAFGVIAPVSPATNSGLS